MEMSGDRDARYIHTAHTQLIQWKGVTFDKKYPTPFFVVALKLKSWGEVYERL